MKLKYFFSSFVLIIVTSGVLAQDFLQGYDSFSRKADSHIYLNDGTEIIGKVKSVKKKKGLIVYVKVDVDGESVKYMADEVDKMYLKPLGFEKLSRSMDNAFNVTENAKDRSVNEGFIKEGYVLYETVKVRLKKDETTLLMQLVNPGFSSDIKVYYDPFASETMSTGIGGFTVAGGDAKSYYVKKGEEPAYKVKKKHYDDEIQSLYGDCNVKAGFEDKLKWTDFSKHIVYYSSNCK